MPKKNTAYGDNALKNNKSNQNSAFGFEALELNTIGYQNTGPVIPVYPVVPGIPVIPVVPIPV